MVGVKAPEPAVALGGEVLRIAAPRRGPADHVVAGVDRRRPQAGAAAWRSGSESSGRHGKDRCPGKDSRSQPPSMVRVQIHHIYFPLVKSLPGRIEPPLPSFATFSPDLRPA